MHEEYFQWPVVYAFDAPLWKRAVWAVFGKRVEEFAGPVQALWYAYRGTLYMVNYSVFHKW